MSRIGDFVLQMMDDSGIFEESQNEAMAQQQIEHDQQGKVNEYLQKVATSAGETSIRGNEEIRSQQVCGLPLF